MMANQRAMTNSLVLFGDPVSQGKKVEDIRVAGWNELNERLYEGSWEEPLARFRSNLAFRGLGNERTT